MTMATWITGMSAAAPQGIGQSAVMDGLWAGRSTARRVTHFDVSQHPTQIACMMSQVPEPEAQACGADWSDGTDAEKFTAWAVIEALRDAGIDPVRDPRRIGLIIGNGAESAYYWQKHLHSTDPRACYPENDQRGLVPYLHRQFRFRGPCLTLSTACSSSNYALSIARRWVQQGVCDLCIAGSCDLSVNALVLAGFGNLRALSRRNDDPGAAARPFDKDRDGFVLGEGGACFVVESADDARRRSARVYGELAAVGLSSDGHHPVIPSPEPKQSALAVRRALAEAGISPEQVDYINAHGTATPVGDVVEAKCIHDVFGPHARTISVSSTKSMTGHLITAASAIEAFICLKTMERNLIPQTLNLEQVDPECELCHVTGAPREQRVDIAISNSFGFGGSNSCAVFRRV